MFKWKIHISDIRSDPLTTEGTPVEENPLDVQSIVDVVIKPEQIKQELPNVKEEEDENHHGLTTLEDIKIEPSEFNMDSLQIEDPLMDGTARISNEETVENHKLDFKHIKNGPLPCELFNAENRTGINVEISESGDVRYPCQEWDYTTTSKGSIIKHEEFNHGGLYPCDRCDYIATLKRSLIRHKEYKHFEYFELENADASDKCDYIAATKRYTCKFCEYTASSKGSLIRHNASEHGVRYQCDQCDFIATAERNLVRHKESHHMELKYKCDKCDYIAKRKLYLTRHKKTKHQVIYQCDQCDYSTTKNRNLNLHKKSNHKGIIIPSYQCGECDYTAFYKISLKRHEESMHARIYL